MFSALVVKTKDIEYIDEIFIKEGKNHQKEDDSHYLDVNKKDRQKDEDDMEIDIVR